MSLPRAPLLLGLAGLLPFLYGAAQAMGVIAFDFGAPGSGPLAAFTDGPRLLVAYGTVILAFMSGVLWGFAARGEAMLPYLLSVLPALWAFFMTGGDTGTAIASLGVGFVALLGVDWWFARQGLAPGWWMRLRVLLTAVVVLCLLIGGMG